MVIFVKSDVLNKTVKVRVSSYWMKLNFTLLDLTPEETKDCGEGLTERECDEVKCCWRPHSEPKCYKPKVSLSFIGYIYFYLGLC